MKKGCVMLRVRKGEAKLLRVGKRKVKKNVRVIMCVCKVVVVR